MKTYVLMLSKVFPAYHSKAGEPTAFLRKLQSGEKIHTIRDNYTLWRARVEEVQQGKAVLSIRQWEGKPYRSKQTEILRLTKIDGVGIQAIFISPTDDWVISGSPYHPYQNIAKNDGLSPEDFMEWFTKGGYSGGIMALIHFTRFRY